MTVNFQSLQIPLYALFRLASLCRFSNCLTPPWCAFAYVTLKWMKLMSKSCDLDRVSVIVSVRHLSFDPEWRFPAWGSHIRYVTTCYSARRAKTLSLHIPFSIPRTPQWADHGFEKGVNCFNLCPIRKEIFPFGKRMWFWIVLNALIT